MREENTNEAPPLKWWERMGMIERDNEIFHATAAGRLDNMDKWCAKQNGHLERIEASQESLREKFDLFRISSSRWLVGALTTLLIALILLVINLLVEPNRMDNAAMAAVQKSIPDVVNQAVDAALSRAAVDK
jgi:hypothetical protein